MARRRRIVLGPKKSKPKPRKATGGDPNAPSDSEWSTLTEFGSFIVRDEEGEEHTFKKGDTVTILPHKVQVGVPLELHEYWVAKIREVRARGNDDVWTRVQWYWSGPEVQSVIKSFDADSCGQYERIFSDHFDYVSTSAYNAVLPVKKLVEESIEQPYIGPETFYVRYTFEYKARVIQPKPGADSCICNCPYNPDDTTTLMHFCPRPCCRRAYHDKCLIKAKLRDTDPLTRPLRLLSSSPDSAVPLVLEDLAPDEPPRKKRRGRPSKNPAYPTNSAAELLATLPEELVLVAEQPIVRGAKFEAGGVAGNVRAVVKARRLVYDAIGGTALPTNWKEEIDVERTVVKVSGKRTVAALLCPGCTSAI